MEHDHTDSATATTEIVELRGGKIWELTTESSEQMVIDRGFASNGGSNRDRWKVEPDGACDVWQTENALVAVREIVDG
ncbi:hypothetical protein F8O07_08560 [Pseudoclavibacter sp. CFCC 13796]|uniref:hypothetical protein n=1 Tax=Pseudoclavibacter sp. CFCC 13796 TaxID=2615179 RepID=UPI001300FAFF|nr:hypothetical protein [Pseudoclavibacter sp. CFCC 13796]KAB1661917.1 hypothetical protein F8O07_08560 [Pseudoclavibacter sp. CFCC 13796]